MNTRRPEFWILLADVAWIVVAFFGADFLRFGLTWTYGERVAIRALLPFVIATCATWIALSAIMEMDGFRGGWRLSAVLAHLLLGLSCTVTLVTALGYFARSYVSRLALTYFTVLLGCGFVGVRCGARMLLRMRHRDGDLWRVLILGSGRVAQEVAAKIQEHPEMLCKVVGLLFPNQSAGELQSNFRADTSSQLCTLDIFDLVRTSRVNEIIVAFEHPLTPEIRTLIARIREMGIVTSVVPQSYELYASKPKLVSLDGLPLLQLREPGLRPRYVALKRACDFIGAVLLLAPSALVLLPVGVVLMLKKGSAFRWETRSGQYGTAFSMLRLNVPRPVVSDSRFERFLERLSITELPQLWNVLRGQMSLVGPRPEPMSLATTYSEWQQRRLRVKPGMTGLAQVHGLREHSSSEQKTRYDLQYVMHPYLLGDMSLLLQTFWTLVLRLFCPVRESRTMEIAWPVQARVPQPTISNAHSSQSSAD
jgi:lipopolysaccharide/colanic/teichoic acid biosynthesis glycosyltransferase